MAEEEVLGDEEGAQQEPGEDDDGGAGGGLMDFAGGLFSSFVIKMLLGAIGLVAVVLLVIGITYWTSSQIMTGSQADKKGEVSKEQPGALAQEPYEYFDLENDFIITKEDPRTGRTRTLKIHLVLAFNQENSAVKNELKQRKAQIRDLIYGVLGTMKVEDLGYGNKQSMQDKLVSEINKILTGGNRIQDVYFSNYVFQ